MDLAGEARQPQRDVPLAMAYMATAARLNWMLGRCRLLPSPFSQINRAGVPSGALIASLVIGLLILLGGPSWQKAVGFVTAAMVFSLAVGPVSLQALRRQAPHLDRPYRLPWANLLCPLTFVLTSWAILWCGWTSLRLAVPLLLLPALLFLFIRRGRDAEIAGALWWFLYLAGLSLISWLGTSSARPLLSPSQQLVAAAASFGVIAPPWSWSRASDPYTRSIGKSADAGRSLSRKYVSEVAVSMDGALSFRASTGAATRSEARTISLKTRRGAVSVWQRHQDMSVASSNAAVHGAQRHTERWSQASSEVDLSLGSVGRISECTAKTLR